MYLIRVFFFFAGNELGIFELHEHTAELFMVREVDLESLPSSTITLQVQVRFGCSWYLYSRSSRVHACLLGCAQILYHSSMAENVYSVYEQTQIDKWKHAR